MPKGYDSDGNRISGKGKRSSRQYNFDTASEFDLSILTKADLSELYDLVLSEGGALRFGLTLDKGALAVGIYGLGDPVTKYCRTADEFTDLLGKVYKAFKGIEE